MKHKTLQPVRMPSLVDRVEEKILEYIGVSGLTAGDSLPGELELAERFEVSRNIVREALSRIEGVGLVDRKKRRGIVLLEPDLFSYLGKWVNVGLINNETAVSLYELRIVLESGLADLLFKRITPKDFEELEQIVKREDNAQGNVELLSQCDLDFHRALYRIAGNPVLLQLTSVLDSFFTSEIYKKELDERIKPHLSHSKLNEILKKGSAEEFRNAMAVHLEVFLNGAK